MNVMAVLACALILLLLQKKTFLTQFITVLPRGKMNKLWEKLVGLRVGGNYEHD